MTRYASFVCLLVFASALLGLTEPISAGEARPFSATARTYLGEVQGNRTRLTGSGEATHLGSFVWVGEAKSKGNGDSTGVHALIAANGDSIEIAAETYFDFELLARFGTFVITGGTGRFEGATGEGSIVVDNFQWTPEGISSRVTMEGTISF